MKKIITRLQGQFKQCLDEDLSTSDRPMSFRIVTVTLLLAIVSFLVAGSLKLIP